MKHLSRLLAVSALSVAATAAHAGTQLKWMTSFNAFVFGNAVTDKGHSEGSVAVGHNWDMHYETYNQSLVTESIFHNAGLIVGGNLTKTGEPARIMHGNVYVGGTHSSGLDIQDGTLYSGNQAAIQNNFFHNQELEAKTAASEYGMLSAGAINITDPNNINLNITGGGLKVFTVAANKLSSLSTFNINGGDGTETVLINVTGGGTVDWGWQVNYGRKNRLVWNFENTSVINVAQRNFDGMMLAPYATVNQSQNIQGTMIAQNWNTVNSPELHFGSQFQFDGDLPHLNAVPEPCSMAALGLGALGLLRRRRKNA